MRELMSSFLSNDSAFGRVMTRCGVVIGANLMFVIFSLPVITMGASYAALEYTLFRMERGDGVINPFKEFWKGFKMNWKQATITFVIAALLAVFLLIDLRITNQAGGPVHLLRIPLLAILIVELSLLIWLFPVMVCFADSLPNLVRNSLYFAFRKVWKLPILLFFHLFSLYLSYTDVQYQPLYAFLWTFFGFGLLAYLDAKLMLPDFVPFLPLVDECGDRILEPEKEEFDSVYDYTNKVEPVASVRRQTEERQKRHTEERQKSEKEILDEMQRLGM